jgi:hypothetical protein
MRIGASGTRVPGGGAAATPGPLIVPCATSWSPTITRTVPPCRPLPMDVPVQVVGCPATAGGQRKNSVPCVVGTNTTAASPGRMSPAGTTMRQAMLLTTVPVLPARAPPTWQTLAHDRGAGAGAVQGQHGGEASRIGGTGLVEQGQDLLHQLLLLLRQPRYLGSGRNERALRLRDRGLRLPLRRLPSLLPLALLLLLGLRCLSDLERG